MAKHAMMTYDIAEKKTGSRDNANFITHWDGKVGDKVVFDASTSQFLSKNPIIKYEFKAAGFKKGDKLTMTWVDKKGNTKSKTAKIK
jgi:sulfur-oxidizing protein SoxZ